MNFGNLCLTKCSFSAYIYPQTWFLTKKNHGSKNVKKNITVRMIKKNIINLLKIKTMATIDGEKWLERIQSLSNQADHSSAQRWLKSLQNYLDAVLEPIIPKSNERALYINNDAMIVWSAAYTHETFDAENHYEDLEYFGDLILKWSFPKYLKKSFPYLNKAELTETYTAYMSKMEQGYLAQDLGFDKFLRIRGVGDVIFNVKTDIFESFFGALESISDSIVEGLGPLNCFNMVTVMFDNREIDESRSLGAPKTQINQIFERLGLGKPEAATDNKSITSVNVELNMEMLRGPAKRRKQGYVIIASSYGNNHDAILCNSYAQTIDRLSELGVVRVNENIQEQKENAKVRAEIKLTPKQIKYLHDQGVSDINTVIGVGVASTQEGANNMAYENAFNYLSTFGIDTNWARGKKIEKDWSDPTLTDLVQPASEKLLNLGFDYMYFQIPTKTNTKLGTVVLLVGSRYLEDGSEEKQILGWEFGTDRKISNKETKRKLVENFIRS